MFIYSSHIFRVNVVAFIMFVVIFFIYNKVFDKVWESGGLMPLTNLGEVYHPPESYDNLTRIKVKLLGKNKLAIEGNKKFKFINGNKDYNYYDTTIISFPDTSFEQLNKIYFQFDPKEVGDENTDSIYFVVTKSESKDIFWNQIFYSSVTVADINEFTELPANFRVNYKDLVSKDLLKNNDTLIYQVLNYFNTNKDILKLADCGVNCTIFKSICDKFNLPCRIVGLMGGDEYQTGYNNQLGYPLHALCEVYSSRLSKWYVVDPTYGFRFSNPVKGDFLNAVEISNKFFFNAEKDIVQDSILFTKRTLVGRDYFKYYENVFFNRQYEQSRMMKRFFNLLFKKGDYYVFQYANNMRPFKNFYYYIGFKSAGYFFIILLYSNFIFFLVTRRLYKAKKHGPKDSFGASNKINKQ